jgi:tRNA1Val (adenine37-N6)-methyltransferase
LLPVHAVEKFAAAASAAGLYLNRQTDYRGYAHNEAKVAALTFSRTVAVPATRLLTIYEYHRIYTKDSKHYLSPFLLRFSKSVNGTQIVRT